MSEKAEDSSHNRITEEVSTSGCNISTDQFTTNTNLAHCEIRSSDGSVTSPAFPRDTGNLVGVGFSTNTSIQDERLMVTSRSYPYVPDQWRASSEHSMFHSTNSHQQDLISELEWTRELELFAKNQHRQPRLQFLSQFDQNINSFLRSLFVPVSTVQLTTNTTLAHSEIRSSSFATSPASPRNIGHLIGVEPSTNTSTQDERSASTRSYFHIPDHRRDSNEHSMSPSTISQQSSTSESEWKSGLELFDANQNRQPSSHVSLQLDQNINSSPRSFYLPQSTQHRSQHMTQAGINSTVAQSHRSECFDGTLNDGDSLIRPSSLRYSQERFTSAIPSSNTSDEKRLASPSHYVPKTPYKCRGCDKTFINRQHRNSHEFIHRPFPFRCLICDRGFKLKHHFTDHEIVHTDVKPFKCTMCDKRFKHKKNRAVHERTQHNPIVQYVVRVKDIKWNSHPI